MNKRNIIVSQIKERLKYSSLLITSSEYKEDIFKDTVFLHNSTERNTDKTFYQTLVLHRAPRAPEKNTGSLAIVNVDGSCELKMRAGIFLRLSAALAKSGPLDFPSEKSFLLFFAHEILFFCVATSQKLFLARPPVWTAIESVNFTDLVQRAATAIIKLTEFYLATSYKVPSISSQKKNGNFS